MTSINGAMWSNAQQVINLTLQGKLFVATPQIDNLDGASTWVIEFATGEAPLLLGMMKFYTKGTRDLTVRFFEGGTVQPGVAVQSIPRNHWFSKDDPIAGLTQGATVDVAGALIETLHLGDRDRTTTGDIAPLVVRPNTQYYFEVDNNDADTLVQMHMGYADFR